MLPYILKLSILLYFSASIIILMLTSNFILNSKNLLKMNQNENEFRSIDLYRDESLSKAVKELPNGFGVILLNKYALNMTLNWLCNTARMNVQKKILFFVLDEQSEKTLLEHYPEVRIVRWNAPCLKSTFLPYDATYMSFFLMRTNLIQALQAHGKNFWMLQADTIWRSSLFDHIDSIEGDILLDQQGYEQTGESRKRMMNGANFLIPSSKTSRNLVQNWLNWQKWVYITDPDLVKIFCLRGEFDCRYIPHNLVSGWEWIYGDQKNPPQLIQMDGETGGNKEKVLENYNFWFLDENLNCMPKRVEKAIELIKNSKVPRVYSASKERQNIVLKLGEWLNQMPVFGHFSSIYGGITSLYLQIF